LTVVAAAVAPTHSAWAINVATTTPFSQIQVGPCGDPVGCGDWKGGQSSLLPLRVRVDQRDARKSADSIGVELSSSDRIHEVVGCRQGACNDEDFHQVGNGSGINHGLLEAPPGAEREEIEGFGALRALHTLNKDGGSIALINSSKSCDFTDEGSLEVSILAFSLALLDDEGE